MKASDRLNAIIRRICFTPTLADTRSRSDLYFMELTRLEATEEFPTMGVTARRAPARGLTLIYNVEFVDTLSDAALHTILCHEAQHVRRCDVEKAHDWLEHRDWYGEWDGMSLFNVACDLQINDYLISLGYPYIEGGLYGPEKLGHTTNTQDLENLMREVANTLAPQKSPHIQQGENSPDSPDSSQEAEDGEELDLHEEVKSQKAKKAFTKGGHSNTGDVARWANFLAEVMDTRKQEDTWQRIPKRLAGVAMYQDREYVRPAVRPLPRKRALIAIDVSGSMDERLVNRLLSAVRNSPANYDLQVVTFNHECYAWPNFRTSPEIPNVGGGTDIGPVVDYVKAQFNFPERILVLTDGEFEIEAQELPNSQRWIFSIYGNSAKDFENEYNLKAVQMETLIK